MSPFYERLPNVPGFGADTTAETVGLAVIGGVTALSIAHAGGKFLQSRVARSRDADRGTALPGERATDAAAADLDHPPAGDHLEGGGGNDQNQD